MTQEFEINSIFHSYIKYINIHNYARLNCKIVSEDTQTKNKTRIHFNA